MDIIKYVGIEYIMQRYKRNYPFLEDKYDNPSDIIEWIGDLMLRFPKTYTLLKKITDCNSENDPCIIIENYKGELPCDLIMIEQIRETTTNKILVKSTDLYINHKLPYDSSIQMEYIIQDNQIYVNFETGTLELSYLALPMDNNKKPLVPDEELVIDAVVKFLARNIAYKLYMTDLLSREKYTIISGEFETAFQKAKIKLKSPTIDDMQNIMHERNRLGRTGWAYLDSFRGLGKYSK